MSARRCTAGLLALLSTSSAAGAAPCDFDTPEAGAPNRVPLGPAALGTVPEACAANEASLQVYLALLVATEDFYGYLHAGAAPRLRLVLPGGSWLSAWLPGFGYWFSANATVEADQVQLDTGALGLHVPLRVNERLQAAPFLRLLVPTSSGYERATRYGFDHGVSGVLRLSGQYAITGGFAFPALLTANGTTLHATAQPGLAGDVLWSGWPWLGALLGVGTRLRLGPEQGFAALDLRAGLRAYALGGLRLEIAAIAPAGGRDRSDLLALFSVGWVQRAEARVNPSSGRSW